ncbi:MULTISPECIES: branched-chain amino acid ABC transporter permease [unclassified Haladaptatus]|uniref:branched-chain amino acid ABC transporter permease n=1 Tax=unclassified Haladaptatus TaxID=2622732 RepID=UPI00209C552B|nr:MULTISPECIES: branched-chain amino acid ABC transporter permease [unclassified Haladaptatus]MCO8243657.1 branched-chain amino acid ABC transporter permease [Haladaptatus sp. AB643]MCO8255066.1 branched-chain amino acid ABC transporter permease [Haladaptatus sp. AB618]
MSSLGLLPNAVANGLLLGGIYALAALGLTLVFGIMDIVNIAHGHMLMIGGYVAVILATMLGFSPLIGMLVAMVVLVVVGLVLQEVLQYVIGEGIEQPILLLFGIALVMQNSWQFVLDNYLFGSDAQTTDLHVVSGSFGFAGISLSSSRAVTFVIAVVLIVAVWAFMQYTKTGRSIRATAQNPTAAKYMGIDTDSIHRITMGIGAALAGAAGALLSILFPFDPYVGWSYLLKAFAVVVLGGVGSILGTLAGGAVIGVSENVGALLIGGSYRDVVSLTIFLIVLILRPHGLFGNAEGGE